MHYTILSAPRLISSAWWLVCKSMCVCARIISLHVFFSISLAVCATCRCQGSQLRACYITLNRERELNIVFTLLIKITLSFFFREALEIQVYQELLENQGNQEIQETQYVLNNQTQIMVTLTLLLVLTLFFSLTGSCWP